MSGSLPASFGRLQNVFETFSSKRPLPQRFFDQLPSITSLFQLEIKEYSNDKSNIKCFRFVSRMFRLKFLYLSGLLYAIQREDFELATFNCIVFQYNERGDFLSGLVCINENPNSENFRGI